MHNLSGRLFVATDSLEYQTMAHWKGVRKWAV